MDVLANKLQISRSPFLFCELVLGAGPRGWRQGRAAISRGPLTQVVRSISNQWPARARVRCLKLRILDAGARPSRFFPVNLHFCRGQFIFRGSRKATVRTGPQSHWFPQRILGTSQHDSQRLGGSHKKPGVAYACKRYVNDNILNTKWLYRLLYSYTVYGIYNANFMFSVPLACRSESSQSNNVKFEFRV